MLPKITVDHVILHKMGMLETVEIMVPYNTDIVMFFAKKFPFSLYNKNPQDLYQDGDTPWYPYE